MGEPKGYSICAIPKESKDILKEKEIETLKAFAECDMRIYRTAKKLFYSTNAIVYRLGKIREKTGLDPYRFYDLVKLVQVYGDKEGR